MECVQRDASGHGRRWSRAGCNDGGLPHRTRHRRRLGEAVGWVVWTRHRLRALQIRPIRIQLRPARSGPAQEKALRVRVRVLPGVYGARCAELNLAIEIPFFSGVPTTVIEQRLLAS